MPRFTTHQYTQLLKTEPVTFLVGQGDNLEHIQVHKGFAAYYSEFFAGLISKPSFEGTIELANVGADAVKMFTRWCYEGRFDPPKLQNISSEQAMDLKHSLIDLWIFGEMHVIPKLQNQTMAQLRSLFCHDLTLLTADDIHVVFSQTSGNGNPLRQMLVLILVVKIDIDKKEIDEYDALAQTYPGFFATFFTHQKEWLTAHGKTKPKDKPEKLVEILEGDDMSKKLRVPVPQPPDWVLVLSGVKAQPQKPGEVIMVE